MFGFLDVFAIVRFAFDGEVTIVQFRRAGRVLNLFLYVSEAIIDD